MPLIITLAENAAAAHPDILTLKIEQESTTPARTPIVIPLPGGTVVGVDLGRIINKIQMQGIVDETLTELFVDNVSGTFNTVNTVSGNAAWNASVTPGGVRTTPTFTIIAGYPTLAAPTSLFISGLNPSTMFLVDNEQITQAVSGITALVNKPFPTKQRLDQVAKFFYTNGALTLTTRSGSYSVQIISFNYEVIAGTEDRYILRAEFVQFA